LFSAIIEPTTADPLNDGEVVLEGGSAVKLLDVDQTIALPELFSFAVATVTYFPASSATCVYDDEVAPDIRAQFDGKSDTAE
jgi:hypothetical protein